jgi:hypothetical protein
MKKRYLVVVVVALVLGTASWIRLSPEPESTVHGNEPARPSPVDEQLPRPTPRIEGESVRTRVSEAPMGKEDASPVANLGGTDWAVVAAIYKEYEAAERRARNIMDSSSFDPTVYPAKGQGSKYMVVLDKGLTQTKALELRERAIAKGLPADSYVTRLSPTP